MVKDTVPLLVIDRDMTNDNLIYVNTEVLKHPINPLDQPTVELLIGMLDSSKQEFIEIHQKIVHLKPADIIDHKTEYYRLLTESTRLHSILHGIKNAFPVVQTTRPPGNSVTTDLRLPRLEIPKFDGKIQEWVSFRDMYETAVHTNTHLCKAQKLTYLKSLIIGEAANQIKTMIISEANYDIAWAQLNHRYQNDRELLFAIFRRFLGQPTAQIQTPTTIRCLIDTSQECIRSLAVINIPLETGLDAIFMYQLFQKLDQPTKELWEQSLKDSSVPKLQTLFDFLEQRARSLAAGITLKPSTRPTNRNETNHRISSHHTSSSTSYNCKVCNNGSHPLFKCSVFHSKSVAERFIHVKKNHLCFNCLSSGHSTSSCPSSSRCRQCQQGHHTLIHKPTETGSKVTATPSTPVVNGLHAQNEEPSLKRGMLATALLRVNSSCGQQSLCRSLADGGSETHFITEDCVVRLGLERSSCNAQVVGIASASGGSTNGIAKLTIQPHFKSNVSYTISALILPKITGRIPKYSCNPNGWSHLENLQLADPDFHKSSQIDILIGSELFYTILCDGKRIGPANSPLGINSTLGWLVAGNMDAPLDKVTVHLAEIDLNKILQQFWEIESLPTQRPQTSEETSCEEHFSSNYSRDETGRFTVSIPWKNPLPPIGLSRDVAVRRLKQIENRLSSKQSIFKDEYHSFMKEYLDLKQMEMVPKEEINNPIYPTFYIPHHFVLKEDSTSTKFRVVFDGSCKSTTGKSLNDAMMVGPTVQDNIVDIISRFRCKPIAFTADIAKMYRQIRMSTKDCDMQRILWRESPDKPIDEYRLLTVTYGTASAPYLATRALNQLATDEMKDFPLAAAAIPTSFYVDDLMSGADNIAEALLLRDELIAITNKCCFPLRKWYSNDTSLIQSLPADLRGDDNPTIQIDKAVKTLGIIWNTIEDQFQFKSNMPVSDNSKLTKRMVLSEMSKLFDPLGWLSPILISAKILMQYLWKLSLGWDELLPAEIQQQWSVFKSNLLFIDQIFIPRCMIPSKPYHIRLAGFCDASEKAYAAVIFICSYFHDRCPVISLVSSKTRVAPAKPVSLPRLELCGAHLLTTLMKNIKEILHQDINSIHMWTDSTVVLAWIKAHPSRWKTFVANRVTEIQNDVPSAVWNHVKGDENPADCPSRGLTPQELLQHSLWWTGPSWLNNPPEINSEFIHPSANEDDVLLEERRTVTAATATINCDVLMSIVMKYSNLTRLQRVVAWIRRFIHNYNSKNHHKATGSLTTKEINDALISIIRSTQHQYFLTEIDCLEKKKQLSSKSKLLPLNPFIDEDGLLRVGGRLRHAPITRNQKHPILLPRHSKVTELLIMSTHLQNCHAGNQLVLTTLTQKYWIIRGRDAVRFNLRKCYKCTRHSAVTLQQFMGDLPSSRVTPTRAFLRCGVDYAGPFLLRPVPVRSKITYKSYLAIFVCFSTRAIHLEVVTSLSSEAFLAAFRRFVSRRGRPSDIFSDCGTNFVGANKELKQVMEFLKTKEQNEAISNQLSKEGIQWHFNPPGAPHFGGLWEAGVKSVKFHLRRVLGETRLTLEEMSTITTQIEACLNSRPLTALSADPEDLEALTPGHFLIGGPLNAIPELDLATLNISRLNRWQLLQHLQQQFWKRWSAEFLTRLQQRPKWMKLQRSIKLNDLVLIKNETMPPQKWKMGRVTIVNPGADGAVRVVTLRTADGPLTRPIAKLVLLPLDESTTSEEVI